MKINSKNFYMLISIIIFIVYSIICFNVYIVNEINGFIQYNIFTKNKLIRSGNSEYFYNIKSFDKIILSNIFGCGQIIIYDGKKTAYVYHFQKTDYVDDTSNVIKYIKKDIVNFKNNKKVYVNFIHSNLDKDKNKEILDFILTELKKSNKKVYYNDIEYILEQNKKFNNVYQYDVMFIFGRMFYFLKKTNLKPYDLCYQINYYGNDNWKCGIIKRYPDNKKYIHVFTRENNIESNQGKSLLIDNTDNKNFYLPTVYNFVLKSKLYGVDSKLQYYKYNYDKNLKQMKYKILSEKEIKKVFSYPVLKIKENHKYTKLINKKPCETKTILLANFDNIEFNLKGKTLNINELKVKGIYELKSYGRAHLKYDNGAEITFIVIPDFIYKMVEKE